VPKQHILVTGANGQVGKELRDLARLSETHAFTFLSKEDLPIENFELVRKFFEIKKPDALINCAAYTAVDKAESEKDLAYLVNGESVGVLAAVCREFSSRFIHISTDYVFDGSSHQPYKETDATSPVNVYGASKLYGEAEASRINPEAVIIRSSWVYSAYGKNFVKTMLKLMKEKREISVVNDQVGSPTYAADLAEVLLTIAVSTNYIPGIYHFTNEGLISWYDFALAIAELSGSACTINPIPGYAFSTPAKRPEYSVLDKSLISNVYGIVLKPWKTRLAECMGKIPQV
jgi:dTDP-4-dehydrorhamnose reductase